VLLAACSRLRARGISFDVEIIGGSDMALDANTFLRIRKLFILQDLSDLVRFRGALPFAEVLAAYSRADLFSSCLVSWPVTAHTT